MNPVSLRFATRTLEVGRLAAAAMFVLLAGPRTMSAQTDKSTTEIKIQADQVTGHVSPMFYGIMTEEINYSYDGGLYAELVRNRNFKEDPKDIVHWQLVQDGAGSGSISLDPGTPLNEAVPSSLKLVIDKSDGQVGIANDGFWGIPSKPNTTYKATFYAKAAPGFSGPITLAIVRERWNLGPRQHAGLWPDARLEKVRGHTEDGRCASHCGEQVRADGGKSRNHLVWICIVVSAHLQGPPNGFRPDIMQLLAGMKPAFLRFPGGNYLEGNTLETRFDWKKTIGDLAQRPGHFDDAWWYWSSDGMGLQEFLDWCDDLKMEPVLAVYAGYSLRGGARITLHSTTRAIYSGRARRN